MEKHTLPALVRPLNGDPAVHGIDILIVACGPPGALGRGHNKPGAAVIDAGIMRAANSKLAGSVDVAAEAAIS